MVPGTFPYALRCITEDISIPTLAISDRIHLTIPFILGHFIMCAGWHAIRETACVRDSCLPQLFRQITHSRLRAYTLSSDRLVPIGGVYVCMHDSGSLLAVIGLCKAGWGVVDAAVLVVIVMTVFCLWDRSQVEEEVLRRRHGEKWIAWSQKIPDKLVPFVL